MGPADADQVRIGLLQPPEGPCQPLRRWQHLLRDAQGRRDVESGGERVVAGLGGIHVVIGVKPHPPVRSQVGNDLVDVHVGLGTAAGLPHHQGELVIPPPRPDLGAHGGDGPGLLRRQLAAVRVGLGTGLLQIGKGGDDLLRLALAADLEVFQAPLGLGAPVMLRRDSNLAHGVVFHTDIHGPIPPDRKIVASIITGNSGVDKPRRHSAPASFSHPAGSSSPISRTE